ncbi:MAG: class I SAM-dependent rRNA methyltransferase [Bacteroidales bacterium]|nr:class I SAM-dependent rRNA methyltransferase [Bacteroidales bacterium]
MTAAVVLKPGREQSLQRFHPWVFSGAIARIEGHPAEGDVVQVLGTQGNMLARGHYHSGSISVRVLTFEPEPIDTSFWQRKLAAALALRQQLGLLNDHSTSTFRLVHGEGDGLPGLVVDVYGTTAVLQCHSVGMYRIRELLAQQLIALPRSPIRAVYDKSSTTVPMRERLTPIDGPLAGAPPSTDMVLEHGCKFNVSWTEGQKTGFFIDQRENRQLLRELSHGQAVLNTFCYTGGFSVYALAGGARSVVSVDSSAKAVEATTANVNLNFGLQAPHQAIAMDTFEYLRTHLEPFDIIVLDPPAFAKHGGALRNALQAYKRLNLAALKRLRPGGLLLTFSCSQVVDRQSFRNAVFSACAIAGREARIVHQLSQPADHPINMYHPEGEYLKGLVLQVG